MADGNSSPNSNTHEANNLNGAMSTPPPPDGMPNNMQDTIQDTMPETMPDAVPNEAAPSPPPVETRLVELTFNSSSGESVTFKVKNTMKLRKAMDAYSARFQRPVDQLRFLFDGQRLGSEDTPAAVSSFPFLAETLSRGFVRAACSDVTKLMLEERLFNYRRLADNS